MESAKHSLLGNEAQDDSIKYPGINVVDNLNELIGVNGDCRNRQEYTKPAVRGTCWCGRSCCGSELMQPYESGQSAVSSWRGYFRGEGAVALRNLHNSNGKWGVEGVLRRHPQTRAAWLSYLLMV